ncbi:MAG: DUF4876 domain-containing protein [Bacteroidales bacterium]|nr:DUF4876 domain-containing protein [Bacteroidales bacterium]
MKLISTSIKSLAYLSLAFMLAPSSLSAKTYAPVKGKIVIGKVYYGMTPSAASSTTKNYMDGQYIELFNQSSDTLDLTGLYIGNGEADSKTLMWNMSRIAETYGDSTITMKQVFRIPASKKSILAPGASLLIANSAIDHTSFSVYESDLTGADFEAKDNAGNKTNNESVEALELTYTAYSAISYMLLSQAGPLQLTLFTATDDQMAAIDTTFQYGKTKGNQYLRIPAKYVIDGIELMNKNYAEDEWKHLYSEIDKGSQICTSFSGEVYYRKTARLLQNRVILADTDNSTNDLAVSTTIKPREYVTEMDTVVTVPATGHLAMNVSSNFRISENVTVTSINATAKSTQLNYLNHQGDSVFSAGSVILTAAPGEYTVHFTTDSIQAKFNSTVIYWLAETPGVAYKKSRMLYKFVNNADSVGFVRDEAYAADNYTSCALGEGEHLYLPLNTTAVSNIATTLGTTQADLKFIPWTGPKADTTGLAAIEEKASDNRAISINLAGQQVGSDYKGIVIRNGKKVINK